MIALGGALAILIFVGVLFYLDSRTRKEDLKRSIKH